MGHSPTSGCVGLIIREALDSNPELTVSGLIISTGIARATLYRKFEGHASFNVDELVRIADYIGTSPGELVAAADTRAQNMAQQSPVGLRVG